VDHRLLVFAGVATLLTVTPGVDMALVARNVLRGGLGDGLCTSAGVLSGLVVWAFLSAVGIAALVAASTAAFTVLKLVGAAYLIYLGVRTLLSAGRVVSASTTAHSTGSAAFSSLYRQGLLSNVLNPKVGLFYATFLPQFVEPGRSVLAWTLLLTGIHLTISIVWLATYSWLVARARETLTRPRVRRALDRVTGSVLIALGVRLAFERRA